MNLIADCQIQMMKLYIKKSFFSLSNSIRRSNKTIQHGVERKSERLCRVGCISVLCWEADREVKAATAAEHSVLAGASVQ